MDYDWFPFRNGVLDKPIRNKILLRLFLIKALSRAKASSRLVFSFLWDKENAETFFLFYDDDDDDVLALSPTKKNNGHFSLASLSQ